MQGEGPLSRVGGWGSGGRNQSWNWGRCCLECTGGCGDSRELKASGEGLGQSPEMGSRPSGEGPVVAPRGSDGQRGATDPACLALVLDGLLGVRHGPLHIVHRMFHVVLNPVNHLPLQGRCRSAPVGPPQGRTLGKHPEGRERKMGA